MKSRESEDMTINNICKQLRMCAKGTGAGFYSNKEVETKLMELVEELERLAYNLKAAAAAYKAINDRLTGITDMHYELYLANESSRKPNPEVEP